VLKKNTTLFSMSGLHGLKAGAYTGGAVFLLPPRESQGGLPPHWDLSAKVKIRCGR